MLGKPIPLIYYAHFVSPNQNPSLSQMADNADNFQKLMLIDNASAGPSNPRMGVKRRTRTRFKTAESKMMIDSFFCPPVIVR